MDKNVETSSNTRKKAHNKILYARNTIARYDTQIICVIFVRGCGYSPRCGQQRKQMKKKFTHGK